jgi:hypothetical protein
VSLRDQTGASYGEAVAVIEYTSGPLKGGRVGYAWSSLVNADAYRAGLVGDLLRWALAKRSRE